MDSDSVSLHRLTHFTRRRLWIVAVVILVGATLRVGMLAQDVRLYSDEALYATFARRVSLHGDLLLSDAPLDKPPLAILITAFSFSLFGATEFAARLLAFYASILTLAVMAGLARRLYGSYRCAVLAALLLALSPLDLAFAATAFLDPLLTLWLLLACLAASRDHWRVAGISFGLAVATKQTALAFVPLIILLGMVCSRGVSRHVVLSRLRRFAIPVLIGGIGLALWSVARAAPIDFWTLGALNNSPGRLIRANEIVPRLDRWLHLLGNVTGFAPLLVFAGLPLVLRDHRRTTLISLILATTLITALLGYWLIAFNTYDRYLHPLGPLILLLVAYGITRLQQPYQRGLTIGVMLCMLPFTAMALRGQLDIGGDHGQHEGIDKLAALLNTQSNNVSIYDYSLDWELGYYLGDSSPIHTIFEPSPEALSRAVCSKPGYFVSPAVEADAWLPQYKAHGGDATLLLDGVLRLYKLDCAF
ncbi:MAG: glycosyltransferase family 39 protein [Chloroflexota bacterium]